MQSRPCASSSLFFFFPPLLLYSLEVQALFTKTNSLAFRIPGGVEAPRGVYEGGTIPLARLGEAATQPYIRVRIRRFVRVELDVGSRLRCSESPENWPNSTFGCSRTVQYLPCLWKVTLRPTRCRATSPSPSHVREEFVVAVPARDVLAFGDASSAEAIA